MKDFSRFVFSAIVVYITLPIIIFILSWTKLTIAIPSVLVIGVALHRMLKDDLLIQEFPLLDGKEVETMIVAFLVIVLWVYISGIGKLVYQNGDHLYRNSIFEMLVNNEWPIVKQFDMNGIRTPFMFVYYIGFWLPAAIVGKIFGITVGYGFQVIWAVIGIWLFYYLCCCYLEKVSLLPLIIFIFFSGLDAIGIAILKEMPVSIFSGEHLEWWCGDMQFSSFTTQLFWVFNQAIPTWILTLLVLMQKQNSYIVFLLGSSLIFCPLPFIGILPIVAYVILRNAKKSETIKAAARGLLTMENILGGGITGIITYLYFKTNSSGQHIIFLPTEVIEKQGFYFSIVLFLFLEIGIYIIAVYKYQKKNLLLYIAFLYLCTCPLVQIGYGGDYCMRASIPAEVIIYLLVVQTIYTARLHKDTPICVALTILLIIGAITPIHEIDRTIQYTWTSYQNGMIVYTKTLTEEELMMGDCGSNFRGSIDTSFFARYMAR